MNTTSRPTNSSLAQRIAKVRNCMLVEVMTGAPVTNKTLFVSLCQIYEKQSIETTSCFPSEAVRKVSQKSLSYSYLASESISLYDVVATSRRDTAPKQHRIGFSIVSWLNLVDWDDWNDWGDS